MRLKIIGLLSVLLLVSACATTPQDEGGTEGGGETQAAGAESGTDTSGVQQQSVTGESQQPSTGPTPGTQEDLVYNVGDRVFFDFNKYDIKDAARGTLDRQAAWLRANPSVTVTVEGHCDERGTREYNLALGERRAQAIKDYLVSLGIDAARVETISYGKERPEQVGHTEAAWAQNRRGVAVVN